MPEPFGKLNRREEMKAVPKQKRIPARQPVSGNNTKLYLCLIGGVLFLVMAGYALAQ